MKCTTHQSIIQQWFEDMRDTHIWECESCAKYFAKQNKEFLSRLERQQLITTHKKIKSQTKLADPEGIQTTEVQKFVKEDQSDFNPPEFQEQFETMGRLKRESELEKADKDGGLICNLSNFILGEREMEMLRNLTAASETTDLGMQILTIQALEELKELLGHISAREDVAGWAIISNNGLLVASSLPEHLDAENIAIRILPIYMGAMDMLEQMGDEQQLQQVVLNIGKGSIFVANFGEGIFITLSEATNPEAIVDTIKLIKEVS